MAGSEYKGQALVVSLDPQKEGDAIITLFTAELGLIKAKAISLRTMRSRLRGHLLLGTLTEVSLVEGNDFYRLKGAIEEPVCRRVLKSAVSIKVLGRILTLLQTHLHGPQPYEGLYKTTTEVYGLLADLPDEEAREKLASRLLTAYNLSLLAELGYEPKLSFLNREQLGNLKAIIKALIPLPNLKIAQAYLKEAFNALP